MLPGTAQKLVEEIGLLYDMPSGMFCVCVACLFVVVSSHMVCDPFETPSVKLAWIVHFAKNLDPPPLLFDRSWSHCYRIAWSSAHVTAFHGTQRQIWAAQWHLWSVKIIILRFCRSHAGDCCWPPSHKIYFLAWCGETERNFRLLRVQIQISWGHWSHWWNTHFTQQTTGWILSQGLFQHSEKNLHNVASGENYKASLSIVWSKHKPLQSHIQRYYPLLKSKCVSFLADCCRRFVNNIYWCWKSGQGSWCHGFQALWFVGW